MKKVLNLLSDKIADRILDEINLDLMIFKSYIIEENLVSLKK